MLRMGTRRALTLGAAGVVSAACDLGGQLASSLLRVTGRLTPPCAHVQQNCGHV